MSGICHLTATSTFNFVYQMAKFNLIALKLDWFYRFKNILFISFLLDEYKCIYCLYACKCVHVMQYPQMSEEGIKASGTGVIDNG